MTYRLLLPAVFFGLVACGSPEAADSSAEATPAVAPASAPAALTQPWSVATGHYIALKDALVASDWPAAEAAANDLEAAVAGADMGAMGDFHQPWMDYAVPLQRAAKEVAISGNLEDAREAFAELTPAMVAAVRGLRGNGEGAPLPSGGHKLYVQHCPMAFDNAGADWVSDEAQIRNPYFGDAMLTCGKVTEEL